MNSRPMKIFDKAFTQQESIPEEAIEAAVAVMRSGRLHRYNSMAGEDSEADLLELEFASYQGAPFCLACASGGYALHIALLASGVGAGDRVLSNAFTLAPVPGAIHHCGAQPVLVEVDEHLHIDLVDLEEKARTSGARHLLLSHMRGHIGDMERIVELCARLEIVIIEDCAHTMGACWGGRKSGSFGHLACFSTQTYKHINSGEGGLLTSDNPEYMARAILLSGSYMLFDRHRAAPGSETVRELRYEVPNYSGRMDNLRAAILRPQLAALDAQCVRWNARYKIIEEGLSGSGYIRIPQRSTAEEYVGSSIQFLLPDFTATQMFAVLERCTQRGVALKWFGDAEPREYTSRFDSWQYISNLPSLPRTREVLATLLDLRIPLTFERTDCALIADIIVEAIAEVGVEGFVSPSATHE